MKRNLLLTPGPTKIPNEILEVLARPIIHNRTTEFQDNIKEVTEGLKYVLQTKNDVYLLASSGTGAMEACVCNLLSSGDKAIVIEGGKFGERWTELCQAYGIQATVIKVPWGHDVDPDQVKKFLGADPAIKAVFATHCETSTGVTTDIKAIADIVKKTNAVVIVDAVSSLGVINLEQDNWSIDVVASASHKGLMLPPGLGFVSVSPKAFKFIEECKTPRYYFDLRKSKKALAQVDTPFTPAINIVVGLKESLKRIKTQGLDQVFAESERLARGTRQAAKALGMTLFADESCISNVLTAINVPAGVDGQKLVKIMPNTHGISVAGGQSELKGKIIRIAHMGCVNEEDIITGLTYLEKVLAELGYKFTPGAGVKAAREFFHQNPLSLAVNILRSTNDEN